MVIDVLWSLGSSILGILLIILWNAYRANRGKFDIKTWLIENDNVVVFTLLTILLMSIISAFIPEVAETVKTITGLDLPAAGNKQAWFTFGALLYEGLRRSSRKK